ncbi:MAG: hypothetical protein ACTSX6_10470 [Candidatus Heimdallarchaeaceae archaeon]
MRLKEKLNRQNLQKHLTLYLMDPFQYLDDLKLEWRGWDFNFFKESAKIRKIVFWFALFFAGVWAVMGFDSGAGQIEFLLIHLPDYLMGKITYEEWIEWYYWAYGKYMHWSVFTIYGLAFWYLSRYYEKKLGIIKSRNFAYSFSFVLLSIGIFEWYWMICYYIFQKQYWILKWQWPQLRILLQNTMLTFLGVLCVLHIYFETRWKPRLDWKTILISIFAIGSCLLWIYYPFHVTPLEVETTTGIWRNSNYFPQTVYTIDIDPLDSFNAGEQFYIEDNLIHLINTIAKVFVTLAIVAFGCLKEAEENE